VWIDLWEIGIGDAMAGKVSEGVDQADYVIVVLSKHTAASSWVERELQIKYCEELTERRTIILPVVIEDCTIPPFLRPKRFADFRVGYDIGLAQLATTLYTLSKHRHIVQYHSPSYLRDPPPLLASSRHLDEAYNGDMVGFSPKLVTIGVELGIPYIGKITGTWKADAQEQAAAWELYVELVTRISVAELKPDEGLLRESLTSLYTIFTVTRDILRRHGPSVAKPKPGSDVSFGYLAIHILNYGIRPVLAKWHPLLLDYEHDKPPSVSVFDHERQWEQAEELRRILNETRLVLMEYTNLLAQVAGIPHLVKK
jgi:hypothetical protein